MKIIFLVDSNKESGLGHLSRNIVFAKELKKKRFNIIFFVTSYFAKQICFKEGFRAEKKNNLENYNYPKADAIVIDSYHISSSYMSSLKKNYFLRILISDKTPKNCDCEIVINHNLYAKNLNYSKFKHSKILKGPKFNLIDKKFFIKMKKRNNITVFFGGKDNGLLSFLVVKELIKFFDQKINVLIAGFHKPNKELVKLSNENNLVKIIHNKFNNSILVKSSIFIGSSGVMAYEAYMSKIPSVIFAKSSNQKMNSIELKKNGFKVIDRFSPKLFAKEAYKLFNTKKKIQHNFTYGTNKIVNEVIKILK